MSRRLPGPRGRAVMLAVALAASTSGCGRGASPAITTHLIDQFRPEMVEGRPASPVARPAPIELRFDAPAPATSKPGVSGGWEPGPGVADLEVRDGRLRGRATTDSPVVLLDGRPVRVDDDILERVEIRIRLSAGANLSVGFSGQDRVDAAAMLTPTFWSFTTPVIPGEEMRTYVVRAARGIPLSRARHVVIRPTDIAGARFEIESIRLVSRKEYLATFPSGVAWQGLSEVYRETIVARTPETVRFRVALPARPWLDLAVGTVEELPVTFRVAVGDPGAEAVLLERTVTTPYRWDRAPVDLGKYAGRTVSISLTLSGAGPGLLGLWGTPIIRSSGSMPGPAAPAKTAGDPPRGIVLIWVDTLRRDHLDVYGHSRQTGPTVRRIATEGTLFSDAIVQATWTKVSTPSTLTSLYPATHGVQDFSDRLPNSAITLADVYREAGYATLSMSSGIFTGRFTNLHKGFEEVQESGSIKGELRTSKTARIFVDRLLPWLETHREVPFFVFLHLQDPHDPYRPYPPYDTLWADPTLVSEHERQVKEIQNYIADPIMRGFVMPSREDLIKAGIAPEAYVGYERDWYDGSIRGMDAEIARLIEGLRNLGLDRRTLVVFTADHGEEFLEHGKMFHGQSTYGELCNVPLILWCPGTIPAGAVVERSVQSIDLMPTLLEISRLPVPPAAQGHSLLPLVVGEGSSSGAAHAASEPTAWPVVVEKHATREGGGPPPRDSESVAIILNGWKLVHNTRHAEGRSEYELYDHRGDPLDRTDVAARHPEVIERLARALDQWRSGVEAARLKPDAAASQGLNDEELERLRSLGYIQ